MKLTHLIYREKIIFLKHVDNNNNNKNNYNNKNVRIAIPKIREKIWGRDLLTAEGKEKEGKEEKEGWKDDTER